VLFPGQGEPFVPTKCTFKTIVFGHLVTSVLLLSPIKKRLCLDKIFAAGLPLMTVRAKLWFRNKIGCFRVLGLLKLALVTGHTKMNADKAVLTTNIFW